jgi:hypothetical protein
VLLNLAEVSKGAELKHDEFYDASRQSERITRNREVIPLMCRSVDVRWGYRRMTRQRWLRHTARLPLIHSAMPAGMPVRSTALRLRSGLHQCGEPGRRLVEQVHPLVAEGIAGGLYLPNRGSSLCSRRYCAFADACEREFGGTVAA